MAYVTIWLLEHVIIQKNVGLNYLYSILSCCQYQGLHSGRMTDELKGFGRKQSWCNQALTQALNCRNGVLQLTFEPGTCQIQVRSITTWSTTFSSCVVVVNPTAGAIDPGTAYQNGGNNDNPARDLLPQCWHCGCRSSGLLECTVGYWFSVLWGNDSLILEVKGIMCLWNTGNQ
jgi:hypothetical protein